MTPTDPMQGNEIIARFMGFKLIPHYDKSMNEAGWKQWRTADVSSPLYEILEANERTNTNSGCGFHHSWDWLMPVVEKIESLGFSFKIFNEAAIIKRTFNRTFHEAQQMTYVTTSKLESTYSLVLEFINWYNSTPNGTTNE